MTATMDNVRNRNISGIQWPDVSKTFRQVRLDVGFVCYYHICFSSEHTYRFLLVTERNPFHRHHLHFLSWKTEATQSLLNITDSNHGILCVLTNVCLLVFYSIHNNSSRLIIYTLSYTHTHKLTDKCE